jgi:hypothetical protein
MNSQRAGTTPDFREGTIWIYVVLFAAIGLFNFHRQPFLSWLSLLASALLLTGAVHFHVQRRKGLDSKDKVSNVS